MDLGDPKDRRNMDRIIEEQRRRNHELLAPVAAKKGF
jgi:hypothetical protein